MATEFVDKQWRIPNSWNVDQSNQGKVSNYSMKFNNASTNFIEFPETDFLKSGQASFSFWSNPNTYGGNNYGYFFSGPLFSNGGLAMSEGGTGGGTYTPGVLYWYNGSASIILDVTLTENVWNHIVIVFDGTTITTYKDGSNPVTTTITAPSELKFNTIGKYFAQNSNILNGELDQVCVFDYALSASQVSTLYGNNSAGYFQIGNPMALTPNPVVFYPLGDQDVQQTVDSTDWRIPNQVAGAFSSVFTSGGAAPGGSSATINLANPVPLGSNKTVSFWFKLSSSAQFGFSPFTAAGSDAGNCYYPYFLTSTSTVLRWYISDANCGGTGFNHIGNGGAPGVDTWAHAAVVGDGSNVICYLNGAQVQQDSGDRNVTIQKLIHAPTQLIEFSNFSIFNTNLSLTGTESITSLYNNGTPPDLTDYSNIIHWWKLNEKDTFNSATGNWTIKDYIGSNNGTSSSMTSASLVSSDLPSVTSGYSPWAIDLDGIDDNFTIDNSSEDLNVEYLTASVWFKPDVAEFATLIGNRYFNSGYMSWTIQTASDGRIRYLQRSPSLGTSFYTTDTYNVGEWNHVAVTYDPVNGGKIYLNGGIPAVNTNQTSPIQYSTDFISKNVTIGSAPAGGSTSAPTGPTQHFDGQLSNVAVWNSGLSSSQIATIHNNGIPGDISSLNPLAWWELGIMTGFNSATGTWTAISNTKTNYAAVSKDNMTEGDLVNGPGYSANAIGTSTLVLEKQAPYSFNNALSESMAISNRDDSQASDPYPLIIELDLSDETGSYVYSGALVNTSAVYPYTVDWGDGNVESITSSAQLVSSRLNHTYNADEYPRPVVQIGRSSDAGGIRQFQIANGGSDLKLVDVKQFGKNTLDKFNIYGALLCRVTATDNLIITTSLKDAFRLTRANPVSINSWDVSTVTDVQYLAANNNFFNQDLNNWDTSSINSTIRTFFYSSVFNGNISNWYRPASLSTLFHMARDFNQDISTKYISAANSPSGSEYIAWDMEGATTMSSMLYQANDFNQDISNWNTSSVTSMTDLFRGNALNQDLSTNQVTIGAGTSLEKTYTAWDVGNVTSFSLMFEYCTQLNQTFYDWKLSTNLTTMNRMFRNCGSMSAANYAKNWGIFANSVKDDNSGSGGAASGRPKDVNAQHQGLGTPALSVGEPCPVSSGGVQHFTTVGRAMSYLTSDVQITFIEEEEDALQLYTANFLQTPGSDFPTQLVGVSVPDFTFEWSGTVWEFKKSGTTLDTDTGGATLQEGPEDGTWNILTVVTANQNWNYGRHIDSGNTYTT